MMESDLPGDTLRKNPVIFRDFPRKPAPLFRDSTPHTDFPPVIFVEQHLHRSIDFDLLSSHSTALMPVWCQLCDIHFEQSLELEVHNLSLSHHIKLEATNPVIHFCPPCAVTCPTLSEYSKHIDTEEHRKKRDRIRAIIDTMDAGEEPRRFKPVPDRIQQAALTPDQPSSSLVRNGRNRRTYPTPGGGQRARHSKASAPSNHLHGQESFGENCSNQQNAYAASFRHYNPSMYEGTSSQSSDFYANPNTADRPNFDESRVHFSSEIRGLDGYPDERNKAVTDNQQRLAEPSTQQGSGSGKHPSGLKRGIFARLSLRRKDKDGKASSEKGDKKGKKKKSLSCSPPSIDSSKPGASGTENAESCTNRFRTTFRSVAMKDKTKKWELVAVKGKATYLKNRSQRMLKDRMTKYRLVDSKGVVVQDMNGEESNQSHGHRMPTVPRNGPNLPHLTSHIWGTGPEALPRSQQHDFHFENPATSSGPTGPAPALSGTPSSRFAQNNVNGDYATMHDLPMSTPKNYNTAVRAYENCQGSLMPAVEERRVPSGPFISACITASTSEADLDSSNCFSMNSSLAVDSHSLTSRMNLTSVPNINPEVIEVKEELAESPPSDALPSSPQLHQTVSRQAGSTEGRIGGEKEREEFWALGIAEHKKGHQILEARANIERLQKELFESTSYLQKLEVEMNDILRRKSELLGLPPPGST